jgi:beta-glucosidase/6-phospho-beta-glucosidase/beta-galactosidase
VLAQARDPAAACHFGTRASNMTDSFLWGTATAAYQIEGAVQEDGRGPSIWDTYSKIPGKIAHGENGDIADDAYHKVREDVQLVKSLGIQAYRFSISWTRILPLGYGQVNQAGIDHYNMVIDTLLEAGLVPLVTLYHWDMPQGLEDKYGGLLSPKFEDDFVYYADICFRNFGDRVKKWATINEPWTQAYLGYSVGVHAPGRCSNRRVCSAGNSSTEPYIVGHNILNAHAAVVQLYRTKYQRTQKGEIGIVLNLDWAEPLTHSYIDNAAAVRHNEYSLGWFADPIFFGRYPSSMIDGTTDRDADGNVIQKRLPKFTPEQRERLIGSVDFLGMNHYSSKYYVDAGYDIKANFIGSDCALDPANRHKIQEGGDMGTGWAWDQKSYSTKYDLNGRLIGPQGESDWLNAVPWGFYDVLVYVHNRYGIAYGTAKSIREKAALEHTHSSGHRKHGNSTLEQEAERARRLLAGESVQAMGIGELRNSERLPIYVTENGADAPGETKLPIAEALHDEFR